MIFDNSVVYFKRRSALTEFDEEKTLGRKKLSLKQRPVIRSCNHHEEKLD